MLAQIKPGTYLPDDVACFDPGEIEELAATLNWLIYAPSSLRKALQSRGVTVTRADFYSEVPTVADLEASLRHAVETEARQGLSRSGFPAPVSG